MVGFTSTAPNVFVNQYSANIQMLVEQRDSKTRGAFPIEYGRAQTAYFPRSGPLTVTAVTDRSAPTAIIDGNLSGRGATTTMYSSAVSLATIDQIKMLIDPTNTFVTQTAAALGRNIDAQFFTAVSGNALVENGSPIAFPTANQVNDGTPGTASTGLTVSKLNSAIGLLQSYDCPTEAGDLVLFTNHAGIQELFGDSSNQLTSFDYVGWTHPMLTGALGTFRGVQIVRTEQAPLISSTVYQSWLVHRDFAKMYVNLDLTCYVDRIPLLYQNWVIQTQMSFGWVRMEENRGIQILHT